jgi:hypothetical protein
VSGSSTSRSREFQQGIKVNCISAVIRTDDPQAA